MQVDEDRFRKLCEENGNEWCIDMLIRANKLVFDGHALIKKAQIMISGVVEALNEHREESDPHTDADIKLYATVSSLASALGMSSQSNREND